MITVGTIAPFGDFPARLRLLLGFLREARGLLAAADSAASRPVTPIMREWRKKTIVIAYIEYENCIVILDVKSQRLELQSLLYVTRSSVCVRFSPAALKFVGMSQRIGAPSL